MTYEHFLKLLESYKKFEDNRLEYIRLGLDLSSGEYQISTQVEYIFETSILSHYGEEGLDWVMWFIWESDWGKKEWGKYDSYRMDENGKYVEIIKPEEHDGYGAHDEDGNPICYSIESLWEFLEKIKK